MRARIRGRLIHPIPLPSKPLHEQGDIKRVCLQAYYSAGDTVVLSEALHAIKADLPHFQFSVRATAGAEIFAGNPDVVPNVDGESYRIRLGLNFGDTSKSGIRFAESFYQQIRRKIDPLIPPRKMPGKPFLYLTAEEQAWTPPWERYCLISCGGKADTPVKWVPRYICQEVCDWLIGQGLTVVQVGSERDTHFPLDGAVNWIGKTTLRQFFALVNKAEFCIGGISLMHHVASALSVKDFCVSAGRESPSFTATNTSIMLDTIGELPCCATGGCWKFSYGTGGDCCALPTLAPDQQQIPKCMELIGSARIIAACQDYIEHGSIPTLPRRILAAHRDWL